MEIECVEQTNADREKSSQDQMLETRRRKIQKKLFKDGRKGEADRHVYISKPKHLFAGKSTIGKRDYR